MRQPPGGPLSRLIRPIIRLSHRHGPSQGDNEAEQGHHRTAPPPWNTEPRWYGEDFPPRRHNRIQPLIHGAGYFPDLCRELESAQQRVTIAAWCLTSKMAIVRVEGNYTELADLLARVGESVEIYVLLWAGAPALFKPDRQTANAARATLLAASARIRCELDRTAIFSHDYHQKAVTIDGRVAYVGGMDLSTYQGDRWDNAEHPVRAGVGWHDIQMKLEGEVVGDVERNFLQRWHASVGETLEPLTPQIDESWVQSAQIVRTMPREFHLSFAPAGYYGIRHALLEAIGAAQRLIYIETQYLWSPEIVAALCRAIDRGGPDFRVLVVVPATAYDGRYDNDDHIEMLQRHDAGRGKFGAYTLYSWAPAESPSGYVYSPIYVHAKVMIVDDEWVVVGSANLNERGLRSDSEIAVQGPAPDIALDLRANLWAEHLGLTPDEIRRKDPHELIDGEWQQRAAEADHALESMSQGPSWHVHHYRPSRRGFSRLLDRIQSMSLEH